MGKVRIAEKRDFEQVLALSKAEFGYAPKSEAEVNMENILRHIFAQSFQADFESTIGYVLEEGEKVVGFLGTIESTRELNGKTVKVCNLSTWVVAEEHRKNSLLLVMPIRKKKDYLITNFTPTPTAYEIFKRLVKLKPLEENFYLVPFYKRFLFPKKVKLLKELDQIKSRLGKVEQKYLEDHRKFKANHLLLHNEEGSCYVIFQLVKKKKLPFAQIQYIGDKDFFNKHYGKLHNHLILNYLLVGVLIDSRFVSTPIKGAMLRPHLVKKMSSGTEEGTCLDYLYSEFFFV